MPSRTELFETYGNYENTKGIKAPVFPKDIIISVRKGMAVNESELSQQPLFYGRSRNGEYLLAGNSYFKCRITENTFVLSEKENPRFDLERYILKYINLKIILN